MVSNTKCTYNLPNETLIHVFVQKELGGQETAPPFLHSLYFSFIKRFPPKADGTDNLCIKKQMINNQLTSVQLTSVLKTFSKV